MDADVGSRDSIACSICGDAFMTKVASSLFRPFTIDDLNATFFLQALLKSHQAYSCTSDLVSGHSLSTTACPDCGVSYVSPAHLELHCRDEQHGSFSNVAAAKSLQNSKRSHIQGNQAPESKASVGPQQIRGPRVTAAVRHIFLCLVCVYFLFYPS